MGTGLIAVRPGRAGWRWMISAAALSSAAAAAAAAPALRERAPVPPAPLVSSASALDSRWIQIVLPESPYNAAHVEETARYRVTSADDPAFAGGVAPIAVNHRFWPESAWYRDGNSGDIASIKVIYRIFLQLPKSLSEEKSYLVSVDSAVAAGGPFKLDLTTASEAIHVNQVGYRNADAKIAYLSFWTGQGSINFDEVKTFTAVEERTGLVAFTGKVQFEVRARYEPWSQSDVYSLDLSGLTADGTYRLHVPSVGRSSPFRVSRGIYDDVAYTLFRGLTQQRDGDHGLTPAVTHWSRPAAHLDDAIDEQSGKRVDLTGGHMDAGDRGKYPHDSADTAAALLAALQLFPKQVEAMGERLQIRESHNGIPDLIDETLFELDWLAKAVLNTSTDGTLPFYLRPASGAYELGAPPEGEKGRVFFNKKLGPNRSETLYAAGALAMACNTEVLVKYAGARCARYRAAAERAFAGFEKHDADAGYWREGGWYDTDAKPYRWSDEMLVAAINLLELTGKPKYADWIKRSLPANLNATLHWGWAIDEPYLIAWLSLSRLKSPLIDDGLKLRARAAVVAFGEATMQHDGRKFATPFGAPLPWVMMNRVGWYFTGSANAWPLMVAFGVTGDERYRDQLIKDWNWLLGTNPLSRSFVTGLGDPQRRPRWIVHEIAQVEWARRQAGDASGWSEVPPGLLSADVQSGSYSRFLKDEHNASRREKKFPAQDAYPPLYRYHDSWTVEDEMTIERLARTAASLLPLVDVR